MAMFCARMTFFAVIGKKCTGFYGGVIHDEHDHAALDASESGDDAGGGSASPFFVHFVRGVETEFEEGARIGEKIDAFAGGETLFGMLILDGLRASALADLFLFVADLGDEIGERAHVGFEAERSWDRPW